MSSEQGKEEKKAKEAEIKKGLELAKQFKFFPVEKPKTKKRSSRHAYVS